MTYPIMGDAEIKRNLYLHQYNELVNVLGSKGAGTTNIDLTLGGVVTVSATAGITWTVSNAAASGKCSSFTLILTSNGTYTHTWMSNTKWASQTAPTLTPNSTDILVFFTTDGGTTWYGSLAVADIH